MKYPMKFLENAMDGLAFWLGYSRSRFRNYRASQEAAWVHEARNLIQGHLPTGYSLWPEFLYRRINKNHVGNQRVDLVVFKGEPTPKGDVSDIVEYVFEMKRGGSLTPEIKKDLLRLAHFKDGNSNARAFLVVVAELGRPKAFTTARGNAVGRVFDVPNHASATYRVRRVLKATASFSIGRNAFYVCVIEVFSDRPTPGNLPSF